MEDEAKSWFAHASVGLVLWVSVSGCGDDRVFLPTGVSAPAYAVAALNPDPLRPEAIVLSEPAALKFSYEAGQPVALFTLAESLVALAVDAGPLTLQPTDRAAPVVQSFLLDGDWLESTVPPFDLPAFDPRRCWALDRCAVTSSTLALALCKPCEIEEPVLPAEPTRDCPPGWDGTEDDGFWMCMPPFPDAADRTACERGQFASFGLAGCVDVAPCESDWPDPPPGQVLYYDVAAAPGGDGSQRSPYTSLQAQLPLPTGVTLLLAPGTYEGGLDLQAQTVQGRGTCTIIRATSTQPALRAVGTATITKLRLHNVAAGPALVVRPGAHVVAQSIEAVSDAHNGIHANGRLTARHVSVRAPTPPFVAVSAGAESRFECTSCGLFAQTGVSQGIDSQVTLRQSRLIGTEVPINHGVAMAGGELTLDSVQIFGFRTGVSSGASVADTFPTAVTLSDVHISAQSTGLQATRTAAVVVTSDPQGLYPVDLRRIAVLGTDTAFSLQHVDTVRFEDIAIRTRESGLDLDHAGQPGLAHARRIWMDTSGPEALIDGDLDTATFTLEQAWLRRRSSDAQCLFDNNQQVPNTSLTPKIFVKSTYIDPGAGCTVEDFFFEAEDLTVAGQGRPLLGPGNGRNSVVGRRVRFTQAVVGLNLQDSPFDLQDLTIEGADDAVGGLLCLGTGTGTLVRARIAGPNAHIRVVDSLRAPEDVFVQSVLIEGSDPSRAIASFGACSSGMTPTDLEQKHIQWRGVLARP